VRVVHRQGGGLAVGRQLPGRGAWLCRGAEACLEAAVRRKALSRALRAAVETADVEALRARLGGVEPDRS
jgi:predicted RNA-binding protein YlxR (DUF448 family)